jgi:hypothetical protein
VYVVAARDTALKDCCLTCLLDVQLHEQHTSSLRTVSDKPDPYQRLILPLCAQSPLLSQIFLYLGACFLAETGRLSPTKVMDAKGRAIHHLNAALRDTAPTAGDEVIVAIILIINNVSPSENFHCLHLHLHHRQASCIPGRVHLGRPVPSSCN